MFCNNVQRMKNFGFYIFYTLRFVINTHMLSHIGILLCLMSLFQSQEARNLEDFLENFKNDPTVKIPRCYKQLSGRRVLVMEWIDGIRCTDPQV